MEETIYRHDFVRIALIVSSIITFIITCSFNGLASSGSNGNIWMQISRKEKMKISPSRYLSTTYRGHQWRQFNRFHASRYICFWKSVDSYWDNCDFHLGWTFSIWGIIYFWQAAWLLYAVSRIFRKSKKNYLYLEPDTLPWYVFGFYIINLILNIIWLVVWDREEFGVRICLCISIAILF